MSQLVVGFYKFVALEDCRLLREPLLEQCLAAGVRGTVLLAGEGINGSLAGSRESLDQVLGWLRRDPRLSDLTTRESRASLPPFQRMKVKLKREIVTMGVAGVDPRAGTGGHVEPARWNQLIAADDVLLLDTRNSYETAIGGFPGAVHPQTTNFRDFPAYAREHLDPARQRQVAMYCTGGIRCEKASALLLQQGFEKVWQLRGGILNYLAAIPPRQSVWRGECFVFDSRVALNRQLQPGSYQQCYGCRHPLSAADRQSPHYRQGVHCHHCHERLSLGQLARFTERRKQRKLVQQRQRRAVPACHS